MDELLVRKAVKGDKDSFLQIILQVKDQAYRVAYCYLKNEEDSMDAVSDAVEKAYHNIKKLKEPRYFSTWFIRIVINECKQQLRSKQRVISMADELYAEPQSYISEAESIDLQVMLGRLPSPERILIYMKYYMGYTLDEIAEVMDMSAGTVRTKIYGNLKRIRSELELGEV